MGIYGLSTLIESEPALFFKAVKLRDTFLVIDGNCISCWLYRLYCPKSVLNGDYSEYERCVKNFFFALKQCNIFPVVILDGAHEARKLKTTKERMEDRILKSEKIKTIDYKGDAFIPALLTEVFKDAMLDIQVLFCQSFLEADLDITKTAQFLNCPVLSFDSDFYLDKADYIPFSTFNFQLLESKDSKDTTSDSKHFIFGKLFERTNFLKKFGDLPNSSFLPLLSFLLGNDYSETEIYESFFSHLSGQRNQLKLEQKILTLCKWLRNFDTPEIALNDFLEQIPFKSRKRTKKELTRCLNEKNSAEPNYLVQYIQDLLSLKSGMVILPAVLSNRINFTEESSKWLMEAAAYMSPNGKNTGSKSASHTLAKVSIPEWILAQHIQGKLPRNLMDLFYSQSFFSAIQIELQSLPSISSRAFQILQNILGIIYYGHLKRDSLRSTIYIRIGSHLGKQFITPIFLSHTPTLTEIPTLPLLDREKIAFDVLKIQKFQEKTVPDDWKLFFLTLADWYRSDSSQIMTTALGCIIFSSIFVGVVDKKLGFYGEENLFMEKYSKYLDKINNERCSQDGNVQSVKADSLCTTENFMSAILNIDYKDCVVALKQFMSFRSRVHTKCSSSNKLFKPILHCFAQLQNNIIITEILNSVLNFPFQRLKIADFYCGTLAYNIFFEIMLYKNLNSFVESKFNNIPTLKLLFLSAIKLIENLSNCKILAESSPRKKKNNRNRQRKRNSTHNKQMKFSEPLNDIKISAVKVA